MIKRQFQILFLLFSFTLLGSGHAQVGNAGEALCIQPVDIHQTALGTKQCIQPGDLYTFSNLQGMYSPLNGIEMIFPEGSVQAPVDIQIGLSLLMLPDHAQFIVDGILLNGFRGTVIRDGVPMGAEQFKTPVYIRIPYSADQLTVEGLFHSSLKLYAYHSEHGLSEAGVETARVDSVKHFIEATVWNLAEWVVASDDCGCLPIQDAVQPRTHALFPNYPNPFNPDTHIQFFVGGGQAQQVKLTVYNILGQEIRVLTDELMSPGLHTLRWDGRDRGGYPVGTGIYICRLTADQFVQTQRMVLAK